MTAAPLVSVVVPSRDRPERLAFLLDAFAGQSLAPDAFEVLVVRDGDDRTRVPAGEGIEVRTVTAPPRGTPAAKRNLGWRAARAPLVAFTDDDCRPAPAWLEATLAAWEGAGRPQDLILNGPVSPDPDETQLLTGLARSLRAGRGERWFPTANLAFPRPLLERLHGFDEAFRRAGGEDTDLALRALEAGARHIFVDEALVWHAVHTRTLLAALGETRRGDAIGLLLSRHPGQRRQIFAHVFWKRSHATALLAAAGLALAAGGRRAAGLAAIAPFLADNYDGSRPARAKHLLATAAHLPVRLTLDLAETAETARGAAAARTFVL